MTLPKTRRAQADVTMADGAGAEETWAICCSGGGVRSAAYCLGALQSLQQDGLLTQAKWILGVSDSGSGMGAAGGCQARPEAVTVPGWTPLTCRNAA